jgi:hypothetical protein
VGVKTPAFPGGVTPDGSWNGVPEWALGVTRWFEAGLYLPLYSYDKTMGFGYDGFKLRSLFAVPNADDRTFFYGVNFEFSINAARWDTSRFTSEVRPIVGWHLGRLDVIFNPIVDTSYDGLGNLIFAPSARLAWNPSEKCALAVEEYADFGPVSGFHPAGEQSHQIYGVFDYNFKGMGLEAGVGFDSDAANEVAVDAFLGKPQERSRLTINPASGLRPAYLCFQESDELKDRADQRHDPANGIRQDQHS